MLYEYVTHERPDGSFVVGPELREVPCERCGAESRPNGCAGDGRTHHHGRVHTLDGGLQALCLRCAATAADEWNARKTARR
jgi:hypothetical protein